MGNPQKEIKKFLESRGSLLCRRFLDGLDTEYKPRSDTPPALYQMLQSMYETKILLLEHDKTISPILASSFASHTSDQPRKFLVAACRYYGAEHEDMAEKLENHLNVVVNAWEARRSQAYMPNPDIKIRPMKKKDLKALIAIEKECFGKEGWTEGEFLMAKENGFVVVAEYKGKIAGGMAYSYYPGRAMIDNFSVANWARKRGIGAEFCQQLKHRKLNVGKQYDEIVVVIEEANDKAQAYFEKCGFAAEYVASAPGEQDLYVMCCPLTPVKNKGIPIQKPPISDMLEHRNVYSLKGDIAKSIKCENVTVTVGSFPSDPKKPYKYALTVIADDLPKPQVHYLFTKERLEIVIAAVRAAIPDRKMSGLEAVKAIAQIKEKCESGHSIRPVISPR